MVKIIIHTIVLLILYGLPCYGYTNQIQGNLLFVPEEDREILEYFFSYLISYENFGYVLFGDKPMAAGGFETLFTIENSLNEATIKQRALRLGWLTWEKYSTLFPSQKFVLRLSKNPISPSFYWIVLINKNSCLRCIESNLDIFKAVLGDSITPQSVLKDLMCKEDIFRDALKKHDGLLGILFGYGRNNSMIFQQQHDKSTKSICAKKSTKGSLVPFNRYNRDLLFIDLPRFAENTTLLESFKLHQSYESTWKLLSQKFIKKQFLNIALEKLTEIDVPNATL
jgi:hypothetical protein